MANTHSGYRLFISATPQRKNRVLADFEAMTWVQVRGIGSHGETGTSTNILTYDTWDTDVVQKAKGMSNAGDPEIEVARLPTDPGQVLLREAASENFNWAFKILGFGNNGARYNLGMVAGPREPNGRNESFDLETYTLALQQLEIRGNATPPNAVINSSGGFVLNSSGGYVLGSL